MTAGAEQPLIVRALFDALPPITEAPADWPGEQRILWLRAAESIFRLVFDCEGRVVVLVEERQ